MPRAVLDPNVLVYAFVSPAGARAELLTALRSGAFELVTCPLLPAELAGVLRREKLRRYAAEAEADAYVLLVRRESVVFDDPDDDCLIALARHARVDALVSGGPDLLRPRGRIPVVTPREFLDSLPD